MNYPAGKIPAELGCLAGLIELVQAGLPAWPAQDGVHLVLAGLPSKTSLVS